MIKKTVAATLVVLALNLSTTALADEVGGIGILGGVDDGKKEGSLVLEETNTGLTDDDWGFRGYYDIHSRLELGKGSGITGQIRYGGAYELLPDHKVTPFIGVEPLNVDFSGNILNDKRKNFFSVQSAVSAGLVVKANVCDVLVAAHAGGSLDTFESDNTHTVFGAGGFVECPGAHLSVDASRYNSDQPVDLAHADGYLQVTGRTALGLRGEWLRESDGASAMPLFDGEASHDEKRALVMVRSAF